MNLADRETVARHYGNDSHNFIVSPEEEKSQNSVHMKMKHLSLALILLLACLSTSPTSQAVKTPFLASPPEHTILRLVGFHSKATSPATSTRLSAPGRFFPTLPTTTPPPAPVRS
jgi:hypothetical protein